MNKYSKIHRVIIFTLFVGISLVLAGANMTKELTSGKIKVACVGNSITYGMKLADRERESYPSVLQDLLGEKYEVGNFGKNGATLLYKGHIPYIEQKEFHDALRFRPDILVIHLGVNDTDPRDYPDFGDQFVTDYVSLIDSFRSENPRIKIILANLSPLLSKHYRYKSGTRAWRDSIRNLIPKVAKATGAKLIDFGEVLRDHPNLIPDAIHPDKKGAAMLAQEVASAITGNYGGLQLPEIYGDGMVLQRYKPIKLRGIANAGDSVFVRLGHKTTSVKASDNGRWIVIFPPMIEQTGLTLSVSDGTDSLQIKDIAIGEVWVASGQSNMEFRMQNTLSWENDIINTEDSLLRLFNMQPIAYTAGSEWNEEIKSLTDNLKYYLPSRWEKSDKETAKSFSAVAWHFGKMLRDSLHVPVGIISNAIGGSPAEAWIDIETLEHKLPEILVDWRTNSYVQPWVQKRGCENVGLPNDSVNHRHPYEPSYLFTTGIRSLSKFPVAGVIWYQGESNAHNIEVHETLFPSLLESWRSYWETPELPFLFVQLSSINRPSWPWFRDSQRKLAEKNKNVWMAVSSDIGDSLDVHPRNKKTVGERLGKQALHHIYSMNNTVSEGPSVKKAIMTGSDELTIMFEYSDGLKTSDGKDPYLFEVSGPDGIYRIPESVVIENDKIIIKGMKTTEPQFVRYGWEGFTRSNLVNGLDLPASTFKINIEPQENKDIEPGFESGLSGSYVGVLNGNVIMAGGCNFPENPMAPNSIKKFYEGIYNLKETGNGRWEAARIGSLPRGMAYGSAVTLPEGFLLIGGADSSNSYSDVYLIKQGEDKEIEIISYPSLPVKFDNGYATALDGKVYVVGGNMDNQPSNRFFELDLNQMNKGWKELKSFPGNPRVQPVMAAGLSSNGKESVYVWGGFAGKGEGREASLNTDGLRYDIKKNKWEAMTGPKDMQENEVSVAGGAATILADGRIAVIGGVNKTIFLEALRNQAPDYLSHPVDWYRFNPNVFIYNPLDDSWRIECTTSATARAGASVVPTVDNEIIVIGGEVKPRIRTSDVWKLKIDQ